MTDSKYDVLAVLKHYGLEEDPARDNWCTIRCPYHKDSHKSARVSIDVGAFKCMACGISGDSIGIIKKVENVGFDRALEIYEEIAGGSNGRVSRAARRVSGVHLSGEPRDYERGHGFIQVRFRKQANLGPPQ